MAENVFDVVRNTPGRLMDAADDMSKRQGSNPPEAPAPAPVQASAPAKKPIVRSPANPDNKLPEQEGIFHRAVRTFKGDPVGTKEW